MKTTFATLLLSIALLGSTQASAQWTLDSNSAALNFLSTKVLINKQSITEVSGFNTLSGTVSDDGEFMLMVQLESVNTQVPIRDQRLRDWVFQVEKYSRVEISGQISKLELKDLAIGKPKGITQALILKTHGKVLTLKAELQLVKSADGALHVSTLTPILLDIKQLDMNLGVEKLIEVMGLASINQQIPITFYGTFTER
ncbi:YceI family protein [Shewanella woodyi]|uniref:YceI family protein n=1 Tax=Shewanella woodyi (strain ATCC 51908 / MS32) TaxID=392500 RepID=B1KGA3_SHEWM|nr:YceI family protein [Shewanella woodyi]ACA88240.1 YceI family protein [Shewanella woodyi ATCC 51908]